MAKFYRKARSSARLQVIHFRLAQRFDKAQDKPEDCAGIDAAPNDSHYVGRLCARGDAFEAQGAKSSSEEALSATTTKRLRSGRKCSYSFVGISARVCRRLFHKVGDAVDPCWTFLDAWLVRL